MLAGWYIAGMKSKINERNKGGVGLYTKGRWGPSQVLRLNSKTDVQDLEWLRRRGQNFIFLNPLSNELK